MPGLHTPFIFIHASGNCTILVESFKTADVEMMLGKSLYLQKSMFFHSSLFTISLWLFR